MIQQVVDSVTSEIDALVLHKISVGTDENDECIRNKTNYIGGHFVCEEGVAISYLHKWQSYLLRNWNS